MTPLPRPEWVELVHAERIVQDRTAADLADVYKWLVEMARAGDLRVQRRDDGGETWSDLHAKYWRTDRTWSHDRLRIHYGDLQRLLDAPTGKTRRKQGRPLSYDWDAFWAEIAVRADLDGLPEKRDELLADMERWFADREEYPGDTSIKGRLALIYNHPKKRKR